MLRREVVLAVLATFWLAGCGGGPTIEVEPTSLVLTPDDDISNFGTVGQQLKVTFRQGGLIVGRPVPAAPWLLFGFDRSEEGSSFFRFSVDAFSGTSGEQQTAVRFMTSNEDGSEAPFVDVPITFRDTRQAAFTFSPSQLDFTARSGQSQLPAAASMNLNTSSGQSTPYSIRVSYNYPFSNEWLEVKPGLTGSTPAVLMIQPATTVLTPGRYSASVEVNSSSSWSRIPVTYTVQDPESVTVTPSQLEFTAFSGGASSQPKVLTVDTGRGRIGFSATLSYSGDTRSWLSVFPGSQTIEVRVNTTTLSPGHYQAVVIITFDSAEGELRKRIPILYTVTAP
jgi:hypothetical protein